jgi:hypothetical protein
MKRHKREGGNPSAIFIGQCGYQVLHDIRELSTLPAFLRDGSVRPRAARCGLQAKLRSIRSGDDAQCHTF